MRSALFGLRLIGLVAGTSVLAWSGSASAQSEAARETEARALFASGRQAADAGLWSEAVDRFSRSYATFPTASALYNLAVALRALGRHIEARDALARLLEEHAGELAGEQEADAQALLAAESVRTARIVLDGLARDTRFELSLDDATPPDTGERPLVLEVDPGDHRLRVASDAHEPFEWEGTLLEGQRLRLEVSLAARTVAAPVEAGSSSTVLESPWFWIVTGAIVIAAGVGIALFVGQPEQVEPLSDRRYRL